MKKILLVTTIILLTTCYSASSQVRFGVKGGVNFSSIDDVNLKNLNATLSNRTGFQFGMALKAQIPLLGIGIQPELLYTSKSAHITQEQEYDVNLHYFEIPINIQFGLDLILLRPYLMVSPYFGYTINNKFKVNGTKQSIDWENLNRWSSGIGVGAGLDIWRLQISAKYNWSFGDMVKDKDSAKSAIEDILGGNGNFKGFEVALAYFF